jgi:hypothetical protein
MTPPYQTGAIHCQNCGAVMPADARFCPGCRAPAAAAPPPVYAAPPQAYQTHPAAHVGPNNSYLWAIAWVDVASCLLGVATIGSSTVLGCAIDLLFLIPIALLIGKDFDIMVSNLNAEHAHKRLSAPLWIIGGMLLTPIYLFRRASHTDRRYGPFTISIIAFSLLMAVSLIVGAIEGIAEGLSGL